MSHRKPAAGHCRLTYDLAGLHTHGLLASTPGELAQIAENAENFDYVLNLATKVSESKEAFTDFKTEMFYSEVKDIPTLLLFPVVTLPKVMKLIFKDRQLDHAIRYFRISGEIPG